MNTRVAAIAGTLLVGLSLFVTSIISNNLNNSYLSTSSEAQVACNATSFDLGGSSWDPNNGCYRYYGARGTGITAMCSDGTRFNPKTNDLLKRWILSQYGALCFSEDKWKEIAQAWCCRSQNSTSTPASTQAASTPGAGNPPGVGGPIQITPYCPGGLIPGGGDCKDALLCCAVGHWCRRYPDGEYSCFPHERMTPTPGHVECLGPGEYQDKNYACGKNPNFLNGNPCCNPLLCEDRSSRRITTTPGVEKPVYTFRCAQPTLTPTYTPTPEAGQCGESCQPGTCKQGVCRKIADPKNPNPDCRAGDCVCVINTECKVGDPNDCWCLDVRTCVKRNCGKFCVDEDDPSTCVDKGTCPAPQKCVNKDLNPIGGNEIGKCYSQYCPTPIVPTDSPYLMTKSQREAIIQQILRENPQLTRENILSLPTSIKQSLGFN